MSGIIYGYIDFNNENIDENIGEKMLGPMKAYKIDRFNSLNYKNIFIGCGLQHITFESINEKIPVLDKENAIILTADAIIDNREELLNKLNLENSQVEDFTDSEYILMAYKEWGENCCRYIIGDYSFAIWDYEKRQLFCARDQVGERTFYYYYRNNKIIFSTLIDPILEVMDEVKLNEEQITEYLAIPGVLSSADLRHTMYEDIYKLEPATYMIIGENGIRHNQYWSAGENINQQKFSRDSQYEEHFIEVFSEAVKCRLRSNENIGIMLSSGLDSTSVAALAAKYLKKDNKKLKSYTSIPLKENKHIKVTGGIADESNGVKLLQEKYENIDSKFCELKGTSAIDMINDKISMLEMPYKAIENLSWYLGIAEEAAKDGCKILLDGQYGNLTISYGEYYTKLMTLIRKRDILGIIKENKGIKNRYGVSTKRCIKDILKLSTPYKIRKYLFYKKCKDFNPYEMSLLNDNLMSKWNINKILEKNNLFIFPQKYFDWDEERKMIINPITLSHVSEYETKVSLKTGLLKRDPTRDIRLIELILSYPIDQFVRDGQQRYLIKRAMKGLIPDEFIEGKISRGIQAADWIERLRDKWDVVYQDMLKIKGNKTIEYFCDNNKINYYLDKYKSLPVEYTDEIKYEIRSFISIYIFYKFISDFNNII